MHSLSPGNTPLEPKHSRIIELELRHMSQLFNSMDASPLENKDLNSDVEEFIVSSSEEYRPDQALTLRIYLHEWPAEDPTDVVRNSIHNYFAYRADLNRLAFRRLMRRGRTSLLIGLLFLAACLVTIKILPGDLGGTWARIVRESLTIAGWVAMWRPMEIYLYDWWPLRRKGRLYQKLSQIPVQIDFKRKKLSAFSAKNTEDKKLEQAAAKPNLSEMSEDEIDRNLMGTFPASDPPSWTLGVERDKQSFSENQIE